MESTALVTGADRGLGFALCKGLLNQGWHVMAGQFMPEWPDLNALSAEYPDRLSVIALDVGSHASVQAAAHQISGSVDHLDLLIHNAGVNSTSNRRDIREGLDYHEMHRLYDVNALGPLRATEAFLPLMDRGQLKRLCFVSSEAGSIGRMTRAAWFGYCMSKAALNMGVKILFNALHAQGYTFRVYHPGWVRSYMGGAKNMQADLEPDEAAAYALPIFLNDKDDENSLALIDYRGNEWPW